MEIKNKKANFDYFIEDTIECGIELKGTEIKSLRNGSGDLKDTFALIRNGEVFLHNMYIAKYEEGNIFNHEETRTRKLLLHKREIKKLREKLSKEKRLELNNTFHCETITNYACTECAEIGHMCREGYYHINDDWIIDVDNFNYILKI